MSGKGIGLLAGALVLGAAIIGLSQAVAQRDFRTEPREADTRLPRYQVVNVTEAEIIIMDVTTGDLYSAKPRDVKPYETRPRTDARPAVPMGQRPWEKMEMKKMDMKMKMPMMEGGKTGWPGAKAGPKDEFRSKEEYKK